MAPEGEADDFLLYTLFWCNTDGGENLEIGFVREKQPLLGAGEVASGVFI